MKKIILSLAALATLAFTACQKEETTSFTHFTATAELYSQEGAKTQLAPDGHNIYWTAGDQVMIAGVDNSQAWESFWSVTPDPSNPTNCNLTYLRSHALPDTTIAISSINPNSAESFIYPASICDHGFFVIPAVQQSATGGIAGLPMTGVMISIEYPVMFYHMFGLLKLNLTKAGVTVDHISISTDKAINGVSAEQLALEYLEFGPGNRYHYPVATIFIGADGLPYAGTQYHTTTLQLTTPQSIDTGKDFYIGIPKGDFNSFVINIYTTDGRVATMSATRTISIDRAKITSVTAGNSLNFTAVNPS